MHDIILYILKLLRNLIRRQLLVVQAYINKHVQTSSLALFRSELIFDYHQQLLLVYGLVYLFVKHDSLVFILRWFRRGRIKANTNPRFPPLGLMLSENCQLWKWWKSVDGLGIRSNQRNFVLYGFSFRNSLAFQYCKSAKQTHWEDAIK